MHLPRIFLAVALAAMFPPSPAIAQDEGQPPKAANRPPDGALYFIPEPSFLLPLGEAKFHGAIGGTERVKKVLARLQDGALRPLSAAETEAARKSLPNLDDSTAALADAELASAHEIVVRSSEGVVEGIILTGEYETFCAAIFSKNLAKRYEELLGPEFLAAVPTRFRIYLFPKLAGRPEAFAGAVLSDYRVSPAPVSAEVFEIGNDGTPLAIGLLDDR